MIDPNKTLLEIATTLNTISDVLCNMNDILLEILEKTTSDEQRKEEQRREEWLAKSGYYNE